jgi:prepilin-type N-terminal cleavage/methylation domain-containing protein
MNKNVKIEYSMGFTLIEVMISMFIMATLTVLVSTSIRTAVQNKKKLEALIESETTLYDSLRVLKADLERAFHYQDVFFEIEKVALMQLETAKNPNDPNNQQSTTRTAPPQLTQFLGDGSTLNFTTLNHFRTQYNAQESDQIEVGYFVESCKSRDGKNSSPCLWRRSDTLIDDRPEEGGSKIVLAEHVSRFKLKYRSGKENEEWLDTWRSDNKGRPDHRDKFPLLVKIELELEDTKNNSIRPVKESMVVSIQFPNNEPMLQNNQSNPANPTAPGTRQ